MAKKLLILGNGASRSKEECQEFIDNWEHEIWGCNWIFKDYYNLPRLDLLCGDTEALIPAYQFREENGLDFKMLAKFPIPGLTDTGKMEIIDVPHDYKMNTGFTLSVYANRLGYDKIYLIGFDLGGKDLYDAFHSDKVPHETKNKARWVTRWREYKNLIGADVFKNKFEFIGNDSIDWIMNDNWNPQDHVDRYLVRPGAQEASRRKKVIIVGNGVSRIQYKGFIETFDGEVWGCNWFAKDAGKFKNKNRITRIGTVHNEHIEEYNQFRTEQNLNFTFYNKVAYPGIENQKQFACKYGWSTGNMLLYQAFYEGYNPIYVVGFDFGGDDVYQDHKLVGDNFIKQFQQICEIFGRRRIRFIGRKPRWFNALPLVGKGVTT